MEQENCMITNRTSRRSGFTLVELMIVIAILGLLVSIAAPNFLKSRQRAQKNLCISNLRVIDHAKEQWGFEKKKAVGDRARRVEIQTYMKGGKAPECPANGTYRYRPFGSEPRCTIDGHELGISSDAGGDDADE